MTHQQRKTAVHLVVLYVIVIVVLAWLIFFATPEPDGDWACVQQVCAVTEPAGEAWAAENCGTVSTDEGQTVEACRVVINGVEQVVQKTQINLSAIQSCIEYTCLQEVRVRNVNYTIEQ